MNWDISIGQCKQTYGRVLQHMGRRFNRRAVVLEGERIEFGGRLQTRYGLLKHQAQWSEGLVKIDRQSNAAQSADDRSADKRMSVLP